MDETSLALTFGGQKGNIRVIKKEGQFRQRFVERLSAGERRQSVTLMVSLANVAEVHRELPQIFLGSTRHFAGAYLATYRPRMPEGMFLWANDRGWMTQEVCAVLIRAIAASLGDLMTRYHVILIMDAHRAHISETICRRATAAGMTLVYVPAKLTWLLQPADTHLFAPFKAAVRRRYTNARMESLDGRLDKEQWLSVVCDALNESVIHRGWTRSFASNGITDEQQHVSMYVRSMVGATRSTCPTAKPTQEEINYLFGIRNIPYNLLMPELPPMPPVRSATDDFLIPRARRLPAFAEAPSGPAGAAGSSSSSAAGDGGRGSSSRGHGRGRGRGAATARGRGVAPPGGGKG